VRSELQSFFLKLFRATGTHVGNAKAVKSEDWQFWTSVTKVTGLYREAQLEGLSEEKPSVKDFAVPR
jgi:hypothetical protein